MSLISTRAQSSVHPVTAILNLRGRLAYSRLPVKKAEIACATGQRVDHLVGVDARDRARAHVARRVAARLHGGEADVPEALPDPGHVGDADPVQLDVLAGRQVGVAVAEDRAVVGSLGEGVGRHPDLADLGRGHHPAGHLDPHHEGVAALPLRVHPDPLEPLLLARAPCRWSRRPAWSTCRSPPGPPRRDGGPASTARPCSARRCCGRDGRTSGRGRAGPGTPSRRGCRGRGGTRRAARTRTCRVRPSGRPGGPRPRPPDGSSGRTRWSGSPAATSGCTGSSWSARYDAMSSSVHVASGLTLTSPKAASQLTIGASARVGPSTRFSDVSHAPCPPGRGARGSTLRNWQHCALPQG